MPLVNVVLVVKCLLMQELLKGHFCFGCFSHQVCISALVLLVGLFEALKVGLLLF